MKLLTFLIHLLIDFLLGEAILKYLPFSNKSKHSPFIALLLGALIETSICFWCLWSGGTLIVGLFLCISLIVLMNEKNLISIKNRPSILYRSLVSKLRFLTTFKWYEWIFSILIIQKLSFVIWQLYQLPTFFSDALKFWSTQAHAIYGQNNWSMDPNELTFLALNLGIVPDYPLQIPIWRAMSATLNGEWNEFVSRSDGLLFFIIILGIVGTTFYALSGKRWIGLGASFVIASLPLQVWHGAAGYGDIAVEAYLLAAIVIFIRKEWCLMGLFAAGAIWSKNDGLAVYLPGIIAALFCFNLLEKELTWKERSNNILSFGLGMSVVIPWLVFQSLYTQSVFNKILTPLKDIFSSTIPTTNNDFYAVLVQEVGQNEPRINSIQLFWEHLFIGPTFGIFWWIIFIGLFISFKHLLYDNMGRSLFLFFIITCTIIYYIFTFTPAYEYLLIQTTIHRTMLQFAAAAWVILGYAFFLKCKKNINMNNGLKYND